MFHAVFSTREALTARFESKKESLYADFLQNGHFISQHTTATTFHITQQIMYFNQMSIGIILLDSVQ